MANKKNEESASEKEESKLKLGDILGKVIATGMSAAFMTEENIKSYLGDVKLPKDILNSIIQGASKSKDELTHKVTKEMLGILNKIDWVKEASKFAETHTFKITAEIDISKKKNQSGENGK